MCGWCGVPGARKRCAGCGDPGSGDGGGDGEGGGDGSDGGGGGSEAVHYCDRGCQERHWRCAADPHKAHCRGRRSRGARGAGTATAPPAA